MPPRSIGAIWGSVRAVLPLAALALLIAACSRSGDASASPRAPAARAPAAAVPAVDAGDWALRVSATPAGRPQAPARTKPEIRAAVMPDEVESGDEPVRIARLVYRVSFYVPASFRDRRVAVRAPAGELQLDASENRLRARFVGPGWPVPEGSEVRMRADLPGVYLFDTRGGRSLGAGQLAAWFEGRETHRARALVGVSRDHGPPAAKPLPTALVCGLLAEWANQDREALTHRCDGGSVPPSFRVGPWSGELTAVVPMELPGRDLRADEVDPPPRIAPRDGGLLLEPAAFAHLPASRAQPGSGPASLVIDNQTDTRAIILAQGVAIGWVEAGRRLQVDGLSPGQYRIGAIRPFGILRMAPKLVRVPGHLLLGRGHWRELPDGPEPQRTSAARP